MSRTYSDCYFCGGQVKEQRVSREIWWKGKLVLIENVPLGVCQQCGHRFVAADVAKAIDSILAGQSPPDALIEVPSYQFDKSTASR